MVDLAGGDKQKRTGFDCVPLSAIEEESLPARHKINFVADMGFLRVAANRRVELNDEGTMREDGRGQISRRWRASAERLAAKQK